MGRGLLLALFLIASVGGLFAAGTLSLGYLLRLPVPCGKGHGCDLVAASPASHFLGVPIAHFGAVAFGLLLFLGCRQGLSRRGSALVVAFAGVATAISLGLFLFSNYRIGALCPWCIASGASMLAVFLSGLFLLWRGGALPGAKNWAAWGLWGVLAASLGLQAGWMERSSRLPPVPPERLRGLTAAQLVDPAKAIGPEDAPVTIVMFGDFFCGACKVVHEDIWKYRERNPEGVRLAFRNFPIHELRGHELSLMAAAVSEMAGEKGRFWEFSNLMYGQPSVPTRNAVLKIGEQVGLDPAGIERRLPNMKDRAVEAVMKDLAFGESLGLESTPQFLILLKGAEPVSASARMLPALLNSRPVIAALAKARARAEPSAKP